MADEHVDDLIDLYALDALDPAERAAVDAHLAHCVRCRELVVEANNVTALLAFSPDQHAPPAHLRDRVFARAGIRAPHRQSWWDRVVDRLRLPPAVPRLAGAVALLLILGLGYRTVQLQRALSAEISARQELQQQIISLQSDLAQREQLIALLDAPQARLVPLQTQGGNQPIGSLLIAPGSQTAYISARNLAPLHADQTYQLWWLIDGQLQSAGTFQTDAQGAANLTFDAQRPLDQIQGFGLSLEPAGGSPQPTQVIALTEL